MKEFTMIFTAAILVTTLVDILKTVKGEKLNLGVILSMLVGIAIALFYGVDIMAQLGFETTVPYVSYIATGLILSKGGNIVYDLLENIHSFGQKDETEVE